MLTSSIRSLSFDLIGTAEFGALNLELLATDSTVVGEDAGDGICAVPPAASRRRSTFPDLFATTTFSSTGLTLELSLFPDESGLDRFLARSLSFVLMGIAEAMARWYVAPTVSLNDGGGVDGSVGMLAPEPWASGPCPCLRQLGWPRNSPRRWWLLVDSASRFATHPDMVSWTGLRAGLDARTGLAGRGTLPRPTPPFDLASGAALRLDADRMLSNDECVVVLELMSYPGADSL
jgi:DNA-binding transcriptional LysR family regulator